MKKLLSLFFVIELTLSACGTSQTQSAPTAQTSTPSLVPTATQTPIPPTATVTPLPTIPTFTPTFDASTIVTATPAERAECPKANPNLVPTFYVPTFPECLDKDMCVFSGTEKEIQEFLNEGGNIKLVISKLQPAMNRGNKNLAYQDLTGDSVPDLMFIDFSYQQRMHILYCSNGHYEVFTSEKDPYGSDLMVWKPIVQDVNNNNLPEVIFTQAIGVGCCKIFTYEWNEATFQDLSPNGFTDIEPTIDDFDKNGVDEIVGGANTEVYPVGLNRFGIIVFGWNGSTYELVKEIFPSPTFRVQAAYDGDWETLNKDFEKALYSYQTVINDLSLESWSDARNLYEFRNWESGGAIALTEPTPLPDLTEYPCLAAYAYYRIMLLYLVQGQETEAASAYQTLYETFGADPYAAPYVEMASAFWEAYQSTQKMYDGCAAAIQYAVEHPEILVPLGSDYHGWQSHIYEPADVCPFR